MIWQDIRISTDRTHFLFNDSPIFNKRFIEVLKFHSPGLAAVKDNSGSYHIDSQGIPCYSTRYTRTFGYYCNRAAVMQDGKWFHLTEKGRKAYLDCYSWTGNYQENLCPVRDCNNKYFHISLNGEKTHSSVFIYAGDYKDGIACVKTGNGLFRHIDTNGNFLNDKGFIDLGVFHKNYAIAKDETGWFHIDKEGKGIYSQRYLLVEPFYNGFALVESFSNKKQIIDEDGNLVMQL
jgi:hypothetical protein